jgi:hypothetical protein
MGKKKHLKKPKQKVKAKSKKRSPRQEKVILAQKKNEFMRTLRRIAVAANALEAFNLIPKKDLEMLWAIRYRPFRVEPAKDQKIPATLIHNMQEIARILLKYHKITFFNPDEEISLYDYCHVGITLGAYIQMIKDGQYKAPAAVHEGFAPFIEFINDNDHRPELKIFDLQTTMTILYARLDSHLYSFKFEYEIEHPITQDLYNCFQVFVHIPERITVFIDGKHRPAFQVCWPIKYNVIHPATIHPEDLHIHNTAYNLPLKVYIQSHALIRLRERLNTLPVPRVHFYLFISICKPITLMLKSGVTLIEFRYDDKKVGYLVAELIQGIVCIKTFLFLTNTGTPEGEKLNQLIGLKKFEKEYLAIDKLSTFTNSDLMHDSQLKKTFIEAGCGDLFKLADYKESELPLIHQAASIAKYLRIGDEQFSA